MDLESLYSFLTVARTKSISKAAKHLHVTQPTLSFRIRKLEEKLGFPIFDRNWNGIRLTNEGRYLLTYVTQWIQDFSDALTVLTHDQNNFKVYLQEATDTCKINIGLDPWLVPLLIKPLLNALKPYPEIEFKIVSRPTALMIKLIEDEAIQLGAYYTEDNTTQDAPLIPDKMVLLSCSEQSVQIKTDLSNIDVLKTKPYFLFDNPVLVYHSNITSQIIKKLGITKVHLVDDVQVMLHLTAGNHGYTIVPKSCIGLFLNQIKQGELPISMIEIRSPQIPKIYIKIAYSASSDYLRHIAEKTAQDVHRLLLSS
jgi:DNA-binding transcriptional LysR family regulator